MRVIGVGGEATVYDLGNGRALKVFKDATHPDVMDKHAAEAKLEEHQRKLPAMLKRKWPAQVVAPLALHRKKGRIIGYEMPLVQGDTFDHALALPTLHEALQALHREGVVVGDLNPYNVLVENQRVHLIDADSTQFDGFKCRLYTDRYTDPRLLQAGALVRDYDALADWYTFAALVLETFTGVAPFGGVHPTLTPSQRLAQNITIFDPQVKRPKSMRPLPPALDDYLRSVFVGGRREVFPTALLGAQNAATPARVSVPAGLNVSRIDRLPSRPRVWMRDGRLYTDPFTFLGNVLDERTQVWTSAKLGIGFYRAGDKPVAFTFVLTHRALNDSLVLPRMPAILEVNAAVSDDMAVLTFYVRDGHTLKHIAVAFDAQGRRLAEADLDASRAAAAGQVLFVPTDEGVVRMEPRGGTFIATATFPATKELVNAATRLHVGSGGLIVQNGAELLLVRLGGSQ